MDDMTFVDKIRKIIKMRHDDMVSAMASGGVDNMEKYKKITEMNLFRNLKKEVETGASGTQDYVIKKGPNKDKIAKK